MRRERIIIFFVSVIVVSASIKLYLMTRKNYNYYDIQNTNAFKVQQSDSLYFAEELLPLFNKKVKINIEKAIFHLTKSKKTTRKLLYDIDRWLPHITPIVKSYRIPEDFKYLVVVESGLQNVESNRSALGFWQFRKDAAIENGLIVNDYIDQRLDPIASTHAACRYLSRLNKMLGSWSNVAAAYNMGPTAFRRKQKSQGKERYYDLELNKETNYYIYKMIAIKLLNEDRHKFGFKKRYVLPKNLPKREYLDSTISDINIVLKDKQVSKEYFHKTNPWIVSDSIPISEEKIPIIIKKSTL